MDKRRYSHVNKERQLRRELEELVDKLRAQGAPPLWFKTADDFLSCVEMVIRRVKRICPEEGDHIEAFALYYGLGGRVDKTYAEIEAHFGVTPSRGRSLVQVGHNLIVQLTRQELASIPEEKIASA